MIGVHTGFLCLGGISLICESYTCVSFTYCQDRNNFFYKDILGFQHLYILLSLINHR